jgi:hypothetical protein
MRLKDWRHVFQAEGEKKVFKLAPWKESANLLVDMLNNPYVKLCQVFLEEGS